MDYTGQNCGDYLIIDKKSDKKERARYLWEAHFEGYTKKLYVRQDNFSKGNVHNPEKSDKYGFLCDEKKMQIKIYILFGKIWNEDVMTQMMQAMLAMELKE